MDDSEEKLRGKVPLGSLSLPPTPAFFPQDRAVGMGFCKALQAALSALGGRSAEEEGLLGFAVGHHTHDADHQQGDADASDGQHPLLVELLCFWKGTRADVTKGP